MILDKSDRKKSDIELKIEIDELKRMKNKDETEIKLLKVEMMKLKTSYKCNYDKNSVLNLFKSCIDIW